MAENVLSATDKSSRINKRVQEDGTLIKKGDNADFVIDRSQDNTFTSSSKPTKSFFRLDPNHCLKSYDKSKECPSFSTSKQLKFFSWAMCRSHSFRCVTH